MDDLISRHAAINVIERNRAYIGHNMERAVGAAFIEILNCVGEDIGRLPSIQLATDTNVGAKLGTNLAQLGTDCISRQAAIEAVQNRHMMLSKEKVLLINDLEKLPSVQPETNCSEIPNSSTDCISRRAAIDALDEQIEQCDKALSSFDISMRDGFAVKVERASLVAFRETLEYLPSAQPEIVRCKDCKHWIPYDWMFSEVWRSKNIADYPEDEIGCNFCDMAMKANDFCSRAERRTE